MDPLHQLADQRIRVQQVGGQEQLGLVRDPLEEKGHGLVERVALGQEQHPVELFVPGAVQLQRHDPVVVQARQVHVGRVIQDLGTAWALGVAQDTVPVVQVPVELHVADGHEAVEPGVGHGFHGRLEPLGLYPLHELLAGRGHGRGKSLARHEQHVALHLRGAHPFSVTPSRAAWARTAAMNAWRASGA